MDAGILSGLVNGTEQVVFDHEVKSVGEGGTGPVSSISTGNILNGDEDGWYTVIVRAVRDSADNIVYLNFNSDTTAANYGCRGIRANNTSVVNDSSTAQLIKVGQPADATNKSSLYVAKVYAKSGAVRLVNTVGADQIGGTTVTQILSAGSVWNNAADNIVSMGFTTSTGNMGIGTRIIILKSNNFTNGTPTGVINTPYIQGSWVRVGSQVLASAASSVTFSGLDGDRDVVYYFSMMAKSAANSNEYRLTFNSDGGTNYGFQNIVGTNTTVVAARNAYSFIYANQTTLAANDYSKCSMLLFSKTGFIRPYIADMERFTTGTTVDRIYSQGGSWNNTSSTLSTISISADKNFAAGSQFDLWALRPNG